MNIITLLLFIVVVIVIFEFLKHHFIKGSGKFLLILFVIGAILLVFLYFSNGESTSLGEVKTTGAVVWDDLKDSVNDIDLTNQLDLFDTRKAYIAPLS